MFIIVATKFFSKNFNGLAIFPFIFVRETRHRTDQQLINHEKIHLRQQLELLWLPFFLWYGMELLVRYFQYQNWHKAYRNISFEREAYAMEADLKYLKKRRFWGFWGYLRNEA